MTRSVGAGLSDQDRAGRHRLEDAKALLDHSRWRGAAYMAGYAVECRLKVKLMRMYACNNLFDLESELKSRGAIGPGDHLFAHSLIVLMKLTGAIDRLKRDKENWSRFAVVNTWIPAWRYTANRMSEETARTFVEHIEAILRWIDANV